MKLFLCLGVVFFGLHAIAAPNFVDGLRAYKLKPDSRMNTEIDHAFEEIFLSPARIHLCKIFPSVDDLTHSLGIGPTSARKINSACPQTPAMGNPSKIFNKEYFLVFEGESNFDVQSWTTFDNKTFLWIYPNMTRQDLRNALAHELAIAVDAKSGMMLSNYFLFHNFHTKHQPDGITIITLPKILTSTEERLKHSFNFSLDPSINMAFKVMRAFNFETLVKRSSAYSFASHSGCQSAFKSSLEFFLQRSHALSENSGTVWGSFSNAFSFKGDSDSFQENIARIMDSDLKMPHDTGQTFCQYMATPLLGRKTVYTFLSSGPQPRVGGKGWNKKNEDGSDEPPLNGIARESAPEMVNLKDFLY